MAVSGDVQEGHTLSSERSKILLVDDDGATRRALSRVLRKVGHDVIEANDGNEAIALCADTSFDVIVTDVQMPDMSGVELLKALHEKDADLSILLISGAPDLETAMKAVEYGALEYLTKPVESKKLFRSVARAAELSRQKHAAKEALESVRLRSRPRGYAGREPESWTGSLLAGRYRIGEKIGSGGMGSVYEATREDLAGMTLAVKILHGVAATGEAVLERFQLEARTIASLDHPNIVRLVDFQIPEGEPAILVLERLRGASLATVIDKEGPLAVERVIFIAYQTLLALSAAHQNSIVHRDLKPENIFLTTVSGVEDIVRVLDFGVAKVLDQELDSRLTRTGTVVGTPAYMAPEQARGTGVDARSDVYGVGCLMYEALSACPPFIAPNFNALLVAIQENEPVPPSDRRPDVDPKLMAIVSKAMMKDPGDRYQSADEMRAALEPWLPKRSELSPVPPASSQPFAPTGVHQVPGASPGVPPHPATLISEKNS